MNNQDNKQKAGACMACSCPCEAHKEHNHPVEEKKEGVCDSCGAPKKESKCGCN